jgi:hypothetical protein
MSVIVTCPDCSAEFYEDFLNDTGLDSCENCGASLHQATEEMEADRQRHPGVFARLNLRNYAPPLTSPPCRRLTTSAA